MTKRMLIDASHSEETRVVVADNSRLIDFEYESIMRKQLRGNIFLAKVTRVEPSLQAAFVNFGGNRHGFLPFSEIHPDYYRVPIADREALLEEQRRAIDEARRMEEEEEAREAEEDRARNGGGSQDEDLHDDDHDEEDDVQEVGGENVPAIEEDDDESEEDEEPQARTAMNHHHPHRHDAQQALDDSDEEDDEEGERDDEDESSSDDDQEHDHDHDHTSDELSHMSEEGAAEDARDAAPEQGQNGRRDGRRGGRNRFRRGGSGGGRNRAAYDSRRVEIVGGDHIEGDHPIRPNLTRRYKIQEVIKRGQIMLVQASKEERGNKGAAVTTYLSLPGRYCVLMPNSPRSGGVSRKIANFKDRKRLREILKEFNMPDGMSVIVRTAGVERTKVEIKRDLDYLMKLWDSIRTTTLESQAPALIYEEGELVKRSIRDIYSRDIDEVIVQGDRGFKIARDIMKMMIPSHVKRVKEYKEPVSLFQKFKLEEQISGIGDASVPLKSGGSLVIHPTEALVSIDVNSGRATKERHIEETALRTNMEAAEEVARQLKLRDLGGLIVIDFIDMEDRRNNAKVERKLKESLSNDRARIQVGRISSFGLMELSRQRISASINETQFRKCPHCEGVGHVRTTDSMAIVVLRALEAQGISGDAAEVAVNVAPDVALYILNNKRTQLVEIEQKAQMRIFIRGDAATIPSEHQIEVLKTRKDLARELLRDAPRGEEIDYNDDEEESDNDSSSDSNARPQAQQPRNNGNSEDNGEGREDRGNRRGGRNRGRRGGRGRGGRRDGQQQGQGQGDQPFEPRGNRPPRDAGEQPQPAEPQQPAAPEMTAAPAGPVSVEGNDQPQEKAAKPRRSRSKKADADAPVKDAPVKSEEASAPRAPEKIDQAPASNENAHAAAPVNETPVSKKKGWWNKLVE